MRRCDYDHAEAQAKYQHDRVDTFLDTEPYELVVRIFIECACGGDDFEDLEAELMVAVLEGSDARTLLRNKMLDYLSHPRNYDYWHRAYERARKVSV